MKTVLRIFIFVGLLVIIVFLGPRFIFFGGRFTMPSESEFEAIAKNGQPIAQAICDYRSEHGLLPLELPDLVPTYLPKLSKVSGPGWEFEDGRLRHDAGIPRSYVIYTFVGKEEWSVLGEGISSHRLDVAGPVFRKPTLTGEALFNAQIAEYERRINHHHDSQYLNDNIKEFYQDKIDFLALAKQQGLLRAECERDARKYPNWCLPQIASAWSDASGSESEKQLVEWVRQHETFANYWYLSRYYRNKGDIPKALAVLEKAAASPFELYPPDSIRWSGYSFAFDAAQFSYEKSNYDLTIKICKHCESEPGSWGGCTLLEFEAAAELKLSKFQSAITNAQHVVAIASQNPMSAEIAPWYLSKLLEAAKAHDTNFEYHAMGTTYDEWSPFLEPEP